MNNCIDIIFQYAPVRAFMATHHTFMQNDIPISLHSQVNRFHQTTTFGGAVTWINIDMLAP